MPTRLELEAKAIALAQSLRPIVEEIKAAGTTSKLGIATELNRRAVPNLHGGAWTNEQVSRLLAWIVLSQPE